MDKDVQVLLERLRQKQRERVAEMQRLRDSGMTLEEIGQKYHISRQRVYKLLLKAKTKK